MIFFTLQLSYTLKCLFTIITRTAVKNDVTEAQQLDQYMDALQQSIADKQTTLDFLTAVRVVSLSIKASSICF
jgi:hypothetical protein